MQQHNKQLFRVLNAAKALLRKCHLIRRPTRTFRLSYRLQTITLWGRTLAARGVLLAWSSCAVQLRHRQTPECPWSKQNAVYVYSRSTEQPLQWAASVNNWVPSDLFIAFLFWSRQHNRLMQSGCAKRPGSNFLQGWSSLSPLDSTISTKILYDSPVQGEMGWGDGEQLYLFSWQRPAFP